MFTLSGYIDLKVIHEGHQNIVYSGLRKMDNKRVILKFLRSNTPDTDEIALMFHEFEITKDLKLPGVIETYSLIDEQNHYVLIQEDIQGISLGNYLKQQPVKDLGFFYKIARQMILIVDGVHKNHIIHKDIKPNNFILETNTLTIKLTDFNFSSKLLREVQEVIPPEKLEGTLAYMAPEQTGRMNMNIDYRSDFYALGVTFYELLTGKLPFPYVDPMEVVHAHLATPAPDASEINPSIPKSLAKMIQKLMAKNPADRYQSAIGIQMDLERCSKCESEPFALGQGDVHDHLNLSQKLYGREKEAKVLLDTYERVGSGSVEALMVCGYSGIGKTMLINEVHRPMVKHKGYFISGKFDQLQRNTPYTAITQAFNQLAKLLMAEPEERFVKIKNALIQALGNVSQVIIDIAPDFERILGKQPPLEKLPPQETQNRMMIFFKKFLETIASQDHPLVLFIDDLQWIDSGSLRLFDYILSDSNLTHVFLLGAYRDNEVDELHPLTQFFKGKNINFLHLNPLSPIDFENLFKDSFIRDDTAPLAQLLHKRTNGNPFFCRQIINTLYQKKLLYFDYDLLQWEWNLDRINELAIAENVVDLMLSKIGELPHETQSLLKYGACIGNRFTIDTLMVISGKSADAIGKDLWPAMQQELIFTLGKGNILVDAMSQKNVAASLSKQVTYQFIHDRVQQAVYQSISDNEKQNTHLSIAKLLLENKSAINERLFEVTDHFNQAHVLLNDNEKREVVSLNYQASVKALSANAYQPMANYIAAAMQLINEEWWKNDYALTFKVYLESMRSSFLLGQDAQANEIAKILFDRAQTNLDRISIYAIQMESDIKIGKLGEAIDIGGKALSLLGVKFNTNPTKFHLLSKFLQIQWLLRRYHEESLDQELPELNNPDIETAFKLLKPIEQASYWKSTELFIYTALTSMALILRYGKPSIGLSNITSYLVVVLYYFKDIDRAFTLWNVQERLLLQPHSKLDSGHAYGVRAYALNHLRYPEKDSVAYYQKAIQDYMESGDILHAALFKDFLTHVHNWAEAKSLQDTIEGTRMSQKEYRDIHFKDLAEYSGIAIILFENLAKGEHLQGDRLNELRQSVEEGENLSLQTVVSRIFSYYYYFMESFEEAIHFHEKWYAHESKARFDSMSYEVKAVNALAIAKCLPHARGMTKWRYQKRFKRILNELKWVGNACHCNYLHHYLFLRGTQSKLKGHYSEAIKDFNQAIVNAKKENYFLWVALGNELAAEAYIEHGEPRAAKDYICEAHYYYERYGMMAKVKSLEKRFPECLEKMKKRVGGERTSSRTTTSSSLDFTSVVKASQSISGEIVPEKLFEKMLHIVMENAGAQNAVFIELQENRWLVSASLTHEQDLEHFQTHKIPLNEYENIPHSIINICLRGKVPLIINHPKQDSHYADDPYISRNEPKSILCLPSVQKDKVVGLIYLENNLTSGAFTEDRIVVVSALSAQIAISLENARHFEHTEFLYHAAERFVPKRYLQLLNREHLEEVQLGDGVKRKISPLFADIRGFTTLAESLAPEGTALFLNTYMRYMAPIIRSNRGFVNQFLGDGIMALFPESPSDAVSAAVEMVEILPKFNEEIKSRGFPAISVGIGINTGDVMICILGEEGRMDASVVSDVVNSAARIEGLNKFYKTQLLFSEEVYRQLTNKDKFLTRIVDKVILKGKTKGMNIYEASPLPTEENLKNELHYLELFNDGFAAYEKGDFIKAEAIFNQCLELKPKDTVAEMLKTRCVAFQKSGTPPDWDGTHTMQEK